MNNVLEKQKDNVELTEKTETISNVIDKLVEFVISDNSVKEDFTEYIKTIGRNTVATSIPYIFERKINSKSIIQLYLKETKNKDKEEKAILKALSDNTVSIFELKRISKNKFELYNIIDEQMYDIISPVKMTSFRGLGIGSYVALRFFNYEKENYMLELIGTYPSAKKSLAYKYAISKIISNPKLVYKNNKDAKKRICENIKNIYKNFFDTFGSDEITTSSKFADDLIEYINDSETDINWKEKIEDISVDEYFDVSTLSGSNIFNNAGFSTYKKPFDVTLIVDETWGFYAIPFYKTLCEYLDGKDVKNAEGMIEYYLTTSAVAPNILERIMNKHPNFLDVVNKIKKTDMTFEELINNYKTEQTYSLTTVLEESSAFTKVIDLIKGENSAVQFEKVGRNDPCPCGSGKKYKKCCMLKSNQ